MSVRRPELAQAPVEDGSSTWTSHLLQHGSLAFLGAGISIFVCYIELVSRVSTSWFGVGLFEINIHVQAVIMWGFALLAVAGLWLDRSVHGRSNALVLGSLSFLVLFGTLYTIYDERLEVLGYITLLIAAFLNQYNIMEAYQERIEAQARSLVELNTRLASRVGEQVDEIERLARLKRFLAPEVADLVTSEGNEHLLDSHRALIACLFCDIRSFTTFSETVEPEDVMEVLQAVHERTGVLVREHGGTIGYRSGDGLMVIFNDPLPHEAPVKAAVALAVDVGKAFAETGERWRKLGQPIGIGFGIAYGYATLGLIGSEGRFDYTAIGHVVNLASRLCDHATDGQILVDGRAALELDGAADLRPSEALELDGVAKPVEVSVVERLREAS